MRSFDITEVSLPNYAQPELGAESGEFYAPPTTHLIATVEDLTDMLDYASEDIDGMDDDAGAEPGQNTPNIGRWIATSTYDVYMVDTPEKKDDDGTKDPDEDKPVGEPLTRRHQRRRSRSRQARESNTSTGDNDTLDNAKDSDHPVEPAFEQDEGKRDKSTPTNLSIMKIRKIVTIYRPPKRILASVTKISSCLRSHLNKNALSDSSSPPREA